MLNLTKAGVGTVVAAALNKTISTNNNGDGGQYALLHVNSDYKFELATFDVSDPKYVLIYSIIIVLIDLFKKGSEVHCISMWHSVATSLHHF